MYAITKGIFVGEYIMNRDQHLMEVMDSCLVLSDLAKQLFLLIGWQLTNIGKETILRMSNHLCIPLHWSNCIAHCEPCLLITSLELK